MKTIFVIILLISLVELKAQSSDDYYHQRKESIGFKI